jgi:hypothetical protein
MPAGQYVYEITDTDIIHGQAFGIVQSAIHREAPFRTGRTGEHTARRKRARRAFPVPSKNSQANIGSTASVSSICGWAASTVNANVPTLELEGSGVNRSVK